jgi:hypothetical protein
MTRCTAFIPPHADEGVRHSCCIPCKEESFTLNPGAQRIAAEPGILLIARSRRGEAVPHDLPKGSYDLGLSAGFLSRNTATAVRLLSNGKLCRW